MRKKLLLAIITLLFVQGLTACDRSQSAPTAPVNIEIGKAVIASSQGNFAYSGTIEESETIPLTFSVSGPVSKVFVSEGDRVRKGQLLAVLDNAAHKSAYDMALASARQAEDAFQRFDKMYKHGNLPEIRYVEVQTKLQQARAAATIAKKNLDDCSLYATTDGIVGKRAIEPGMTATPNVTSITIVKIAKVYARVPVSENEISTIKKGQNATIKIGALDAAFNGTIEEIGVLADPLSHTYTIKIAIQNGKQNIKPGMVCQATIANASGMRSLVVPSAAVLVDETGKNFVYTVDAEQKKAVRKDVKVGKLVNAGIEIAAGLKEDELIVTMGQHKLVDQSPVNFTHP